MIIDHRPPIADPRPVTGTPVLEEAHAAIAQADDVIGKMCANDPMLRQLVELVREREVVRMKLRDEQFWHNVSRQNIQALTTAGDTMHDFLARVSSDGCRTNELADECAAVLDAWERVSY